MSGTDADFDTRWALDGGGGGMLPQEVSFRWTGFSDFLQASSSATVGANGPTVDFPSCVGCVECRPGFRSGGGGGALTLAEECFA